MNPNILTFLQETLQRLFTKSPKFFKVWMLISGALVLITGLPDFINFLHIAGFTIPNVWNEHVTIAVAWASRAALLMATLTTKSIPIAKTEGGNILKVTDETKLPFTAAVEQKSAVKNNIDTVEVKVTS